MQAAAGKQLIVEQMTISIVTRAYPIAPRSRSEIAVAMYDPTPGSRSSDWKP